MIGNNSCGTHSLLGGKTVDNVEELRILLYDGTQMTVGATPARLNSSAISADRWPPGRNLFQAAVDSRSVRRSDPREIIQTFPGASPGYNLDELLPENGFNVARALVGSEGTCVIVLEAKLRLIHSPQHRALVGFGYPGRLLRRRSCARNSGV